jgi:hypothetical protein
VIILSGCWAERKRLKNLDRRDLGKGDSHIAASCPGDHSWSEHGAGGDPAAVETV